MTSMPAPDSHPVALAGANKLARLAVVGASL
jgi:hypothetical protein